MREISLMEYEPARTKDVKLSVTPWMDLESTMLSEVRRTQKDKQCFVSQM